MHKEKPYNLGIFYAILAMALLSGCDDDEAPEFPRVTISCSTHPQAPENLSDAPFGLTPRVNWLAEVLALEASGEFIAPEALYQRVNIELTGLFAHYPDKISTHVNSCLAANELVLTMEPEAMEDVVFGQYTAWDELNTVLRVFDFTPLESTNAVLLRFDGVYNVNRVIHEYEALPGVLSGAQRHLPDSSAACLAIRAQTHFYMFRQARGDCDAECVEEAFFAVEVDSWGNIMPQGTWDGQGRPPDWFATAHDCRALLAGQREGFKTHVFPPD
jgi:hypothetical protein